jgi:serine/threonine protein kinase
MLKLILAIVGNPVREECRHVSDKAVKYLDDRTMFPAARRVNWAAQFPKASAQALDLLDSLLQFSPERRLTAAQALAHPYMADLHDVDDEPASEGCFDFAFERQKLSLAELRQQVVEESNMFAHASEVAGLPQRG